MSTIIDRAHLSIEVSSAKGRKILSCVKKMLSESLGMNIKTLQYLKGTPTVMWLFMPLVFDGNYRSNGASVKDYTEKGRYSSYKCVYHLDGYLWAWDTSLYD